MVGVALWFVDPNNWVVNRVLKEKEKKNMNYMHFCRCFDVSVQEVVKEDAKIDINQ